MGVFRSLSSIARRRVDGPDALARMNTLAAKRRVLEAVRYGAQHAPGLDRAAVWDRLSALRMEAADLAMEAAEARPDWPPKLPDVFPGKDLPEIDASELDWRKLGGGVLHHGSLLVRNLVDDATAARLCDRIDATLDAYDRLQSGGERSPADCAYLPVALSPEEPLAVTRGWSRDSGGVWAVEAPVLFETVVALYRTNGLLDAIECYLGEPPLLSVGKTVLRRAEPQGHDGFHQDGAFMGAGTRAVNVWLALSDCGQEAPGLELVPARLPGIVATGTEGAAIDWAVGRPVAERVAGERGLVMPTFRAGDALIFDHLMLHSTGFLPGMTKRRYAVEAWFFAPSAAPRDQVPLAI